MRGVLLGVFASLFLAGCGADSVWAPEEAVRAAAYRPAGPTSITLFTMVNNRSNEGAHSAIMINASQRVIFDPAGTWWHRTAPERHDVHYGITPTMLKFFIDYHARETYRVVTQTVVVTPDVAEQALQLVEANGAVPKAFCANATTRIFSKLPGFQSVGGGMFPGRIMKSFGELPGVETKVYYDEDSDDNSALLSSQQSASAASQPSR
ncbi:hypothetical protein [Actibacterium lipolyticum]|uniref:Lipoprotein n=1 Tax=Actibacterium lipolyticum TaxID=1524263 RepID=A0A238KT19_9RHOB|nr:hypothetical protein [Actibacterium lipolyticum]SMX45751.1 hypothetical protein COL8621_02881 [Actibacterium lipolyticum]